MHDPRERHLAALKRILRYVRGTLDLGLHIRASSQSNLMVYSDAVWVVALTLVSPPRATLCSSVTTWSPGPPSARTLSPAPVQKLSTVL